MKYVLSAAQTKAAEQNAMKSGVSETLLRMSASLAVADIVEKLVTDKADKSIAVFCGNGGNGCDGLLTACRLHSIGHSVTAYTVGDYNKVPEDIKAFVKNSGLNVEPAVSYSGGAAIFVDAIFGIGLNKPVSGEHLQIIERLNAEHAFKIALDVPSGLNCDTGEVMGACFKADETVTFSCYKPGMLFGKGRDMCGKIVVRDIGIKTVSNMYVYEDGDFPAYERSASAHKGTAGKVYILGGCGSMVGAPIMAGAAAHTAYLNGAGTVTVCVPNVHRAAMSARAMMAVIKFMPDTSDGFIRFDKDALDDIIGNASAICMGVGMGANPELNRIVKYVCAEFDKAVVIDADALNSVKGDYSFIKSAKAKVILTPHVGEFKRLTGKDATVENAISLAEELNCVVVLKSATTIITDGKQVRLNVAGTPAMAKGGMGDMLSGCITALTCAYDTIDAATIACYRNGMGAERAVSSYAQMMLTASDVLKFSDYNE